MAIRTYDVLLDSYNALIPEPIVGRQGDKNGAVTLHVTITDRGSAVDLTGQTINLMAETAKGTAIVADNLGVTLTDAVNGKFDYAIPNALWSESGKIKKAYFSLNDTDGQQTTYDLILIVKKAIDISKDKADDYITIIDGTMRDLQQKIDDLSANIATVVDAYNGGDFYNKTESDERFAQLNVANSLDVTVDGGVQEPFTTDLSVFKTTINPDSNVAKIGLLQDIHFQRSIYSDEYGRATNLGLMHIQHMGKLKDQLNAVVYNGDNVHGREVKGSTVNRIKQLINTSKMALGDLPELWTIGNHDDNGVYFDGVAKRVNTLTLDELKAAFEIGQTYAYHDLPDQKVRVIVMNSFENPEIYNTDGSIKYNRSYNSIFSGTQLNWIASTLLSTPQDYSVISFMHCPPLGFDGNLPYAKYQNINHDLMLGLYRAFINGESYSEIGASTDYPAAVTADFSSHGKGNFVGIVAGHEHHDLAPQVKNGIRVIERTCNLGFGTGRTIGYVSEDAFDVIEVDSTKNHVKFNRFGAGNSLEFDY